MRIMGSFSHNSHLPLIIEFDTVFIGSMIAPMSQSYLNLSDGSKVTKLEFISLCVLIAIAEFCALLHGGTNELVFVTVVIISSIVLFAIETKIPKFSK